MRDISIIISNEYTVKSGEINGIKVNSYYVKNNNYCDNHQGEISLKGAVGAINVFTEAYGDYPYDEIDVVQSAYEYGGFEAPALIRISRIYSLNYFRDGVQGEEIKEGENNLLSTVVHEIAHQWFYGIVGNDQYNEAWLDESFAAFSEQVYFRSIGKSEEDIAKEMEEFLEKIPHKGNVTIDRSFEKLEEDNDYTKAVYMRGAGFLYKLEQAMGKDRFYEFIKKYYTTYSFKEAHTEDFLNTLKPYIKNNDQAEKLIKKYLSCAN